MRVIEVLGDSPAFAQYHGLRLPKPRQTYSLGAERGDGKFGSVWSARPEKPRGEPAFVVKESKEVAALADRVVALQRALANCPDPTWPEGLLAFPYAVVVADFEGDEREAIFMLDLVELGYEKAEPHFDQPQVQEFQRRPVYERVELAHAYARGAEILESVRFVHGDQNLPNLMLNLKTLDTQIVDLDAGAVLVGGEERSLAEGKGDDCVPPETKVLTANGFAVDVSTWDLEAERWAVGMLVGYLAFGIAPTYLLARITASFIDAYAEEGPWPRIDPKAPHAQANLEPLQKFWGPVLEDAPGHLTETFGRFFRAGTRGGERPTARDWVDALEQARQKPRFVSFEVTPPVVPEGGEVVISWEAEGAEHVEHPELGQLSAAGEETLVMEKSGRHTLAAANYYGRVEASSEVVRVVPLPKLTSIPIAGFPGLELKTKIATAAPPRPVPGFPPRLIEGAGIPAAAPRLPRGPQAAPPQPRFGQIFRPIPVSRRIRTMMRKEPTR